MSLQHHNQPPITSPEVAFDRRADTGTFADICHALGACGVQPTEEAPFPCLTPDVTYTIPLPATPSSMSPSAQQIH